MAEDQLRQDGDLRASFAGRMIIEHYLFNPPNGDCDSGAESHSVAALQLTRFPLDRREQKYHPAASGVFAVRTREVD